MNIRLLKNQDTQVLEEYLACPAVSVKNQRNKKTTIGQVVVSIFEERVMKIIEVAPYDPNWPHIYEKEAALIWQALSGNCLAIHHIGSRDVLVGKEV